MTGDYYETTHRGRRWRQRGDQPLLNRRRIRTLTSAERQGMAGILLDIGSGEGHFARRANQRFNVVASDYLEAGAARSRLALGPGRVVRADGTLMPFRSACAIVVTLWDVSEHVLNSQELFAECHRVLQDGGLLAMSTPNPGALSVLRRGSGSTQFVDATHINIQPATEWVRQLEYVGFEVLQCGGDAWWDPPYHRGVPRMLYLLLSQLMFWARFAWPVKTAENTVILARRTIRQHPLST